MKRRSLFWKIFITYLVTLIVIGFLVGGFFHFGFSRRNHGAINAIATNVIYHVDHLIDQVGNPPDMARAKRLANDLHFSLRIESPLETWQTAPEVKSAQYFEDHGVRWDPHTRIGGHAGRLFVVRESHGIKYIFLLWNDAAFAPSLRRIIVLLGFVGIVLLLSFLTVRWLLRPLNAMISAAKSVGEGNLDYRMYEGHHHEFSELARTFNGMVEQIRNMLEQKERLLIDVSHDLRTPITRLKLTAELIETNDSSAKFLAQIKSDIKQLETMVDTLLESYRKKSMRNRFVQSPVNLSSLISHVTAEFQQTPPHVELKNVPSNITINGDEMGLSRALRNIIDNALKYSSTQIKPVQVSLSDSPSQITIAVQDFGGGIESSQLDQLFEPFFRIDKARTPTASLHPQGFGLGLYLAREIVRSHDGDVQILSVIGQGTTVTITLPRR